MHRGGARTVQGGVEAIFSDSRELLRILKLFFKKLISGRAGYPEISLVPPKPFPLSLSHRPGGSCRGELAAPGQATADSTCVLPRNFSLYLPASPTLSSCRPARLAWPIPVLRRIPTLFVPSAHFGCERLMRVGRPMEGRVTSPRRRRAAVSTPGQQSGHGPGLGLTERERAPRNAPPRARHPLTYKLKLSDDESLPYSIRNRAAARGSPFPGRHSAPRRADAAERGHNSRL